MLRREHGETWSGPITGYGIIQDKRRSSSSRNFLLLTTDSHERFFFLSKPGSTLPSHATTGGIFFPPETPLV
jgi:hypothetical protein